MASERGHASSRGRWSNTLVLVVCALGCQLCAPFVLPATSAPRGALVDVFGSKATAVAVAGEGCTGRSVITSSNSFSLARRAAVASELRAAGVDLLDSEAVLAKFKRLQVG